jgi:hypothetical protein
MQMDFFSINHAKKETPTGVYSGITKEFVIGVDDKIDPLRKDYCDMGAPYTVWKHGAIPPIIGFHGYRKQLNFRDELVHQGWFDTDLLTFREYQRWLAAQPGVTFNKLLVEHDILVVEPFDCKHNNGMAEDFALTRSENDWEALEAVMNEHGEFNFDTNFIRPMHFVCRDYVFHRWMRFWDKVRQELEPLILSEDAVTPEYPSRAMAFLSERIWSLWLDSTMLRVKEFPLLRCWDAM